MQSNSYSSKSLHHEFCGAKQTHSSMNKNNLSHNRYHENVPANRQTPQNKTVAQKNYYGQSNKTIFTGNQQCRKCTKLQQELQQSYNNQQSLSQSIVQINQCYKQKITILQATITKYSIRCQQLLEWKQQYIDREMQNNQKYQQQNTKLLKTLQSVLKEYEQEKQTNQLLQQKVQILEQRESKRQQEFRDNQEEVQRILGERMKEIEELKAQLAVLNTQLEHEGQQQSGQHKQQEQFGQDMYQVQQETQTNLKGNKNNKQVNQISFTDIIYQKQEEQNESPEKHSKNKSPQCQNIVPSDTAQSYIEQKQCNLKETQFTEQQQIQVGSMQQQKTDDSVLKQITNNQTFTEQQGLDGNSKISNQRNVQQEQADTQIS